jgi:outer membrane protein OmpA-like peptidoglycan-associated protein
MKRFLNHFIAFGLLAAAVFTTSSVNAQEMLGAVNSNYSGTTSLGFNPSTFVDNRLGLDIGLGLGGFSIDNDYVYFPRGKASFPGFNDIFNSNSGDDRKFSDVKTYNTSAKNAAMNATGRFLPAAFHIKDHWFAIQPWTIRTSLTLDNVQYALAKFAYEQDGIHYKPLHGQYFDMPSMNVGFMTWSEVGLTYGHSILNQNKSYLKGALTIKREFGHVALYSRVNEGAKFRITRDPKDYDYSLGDDLNNNGIPNEHADSVIYDTTYANGTGRLEMTNMNIEYGSAYNPDNQDYSPYTPDGVLGTGWGFDFGLTYEFRPDYNKFTYEMDGKTYDDPTQNHYLLRIGAALTDVGKITFDDHSTAYQLQSDYVNWKGWDSIEVLPPVFSGEVSNDQGKAGFDTTFSKLFYKGNPTASERGKKFDMGLPRAFNLNVDWQVVRYAFLNVTYISRWKRNTPEVAATNMLAVTPRFEYHWIDVALPMSWYQYNRFRMGISLRVAGLTVGSDKLGGVLGLTDMGGMDYYAKLSFLLERRKIADRDGDHVSDKLDKCPDMPGPFATLGCPDRDGDGIIDSEDACPDQFGKKELHGCPDKDGDGIIDKDDLCPDVPGLAQFNGCPDTDGDGIPDPLDSCVTVPGLAEFHGCPDTDGDGIPDLQDSCPTVKGPIELHGCPDTDGDGLIDKDDSCPLVAGPISNKGCPVVQKAPVKVELTKEEEEVINKVFKNLEFETAKATIRESSYPSLDELANLLKKKPNFKLLIDGHTDNVGGAAYNLKLSNARANSVKQYLVDKGVDGSRITAKGYGMTKPIASNKTAAGRQKNRRVEFTIVE